MKAGILYNAKDIGLGEAPTPKIGPYEVLLESKAAGIVVRICIFIRESLKPGSVTLLSRDMNLAE